MQQQDLNNAIEYAREMQRRAQNFEKDEKKISDINNVFRPEEESAFSRNSDTNNKSLPFSGSNSKRRNHFRAEETAQNNDISLILALILILLHDGADKSLILALLYIMS